MPRTRKSKLLGCVLAAVVAMGLIMWITVRSHPPSPPRFTFINYTNNGGQMEALFRLDHPASRVNGDGLNQLHYLTSTGWARPTTGSIGWRWFGFDKTGSTAAIEVVTTNVPARVVMTLWVGRQGILGVFDDCRNRWRKMTGQGKISHDSPVYLTNETAVSALAP